MSSHFFLPPRSRHSVSLSSACPALGPCPLQLPYFFLQSNRHSNTKQTVNRSHLTQNGSKSQKRGHTIQVSTSHRSHLPCHPSTTIHKRPRSIAIYTQSNRSRLLPTTIIRSPPSIPSRHTIQRHTSPSIQLGIASNQASQSESHILQITARCSSMPTKRDIGMVQSFQSR